MSQPTIRWRWRCLWCGAVARYRRDLIHALDCHPLAVEKPERVGYGA